MRAYPKILFITPRLVLQRTLAATLLMLVSVISPALTNLTSWGPIVCEYFLLGGISWGVRDALCVRATSLPLNFKFYRPLS